MNVRTTLCRCRTLTRYAGKLWKREIETFLKVKKKAEQEAFSRYGLAYIVDERLPAKLETM